MVKQGSLEKTAFPAEGAAAEWEVNRTLGLTLHLPIDNDRTEHHSHWRGDEKITVTTSHTNPGGRHGIDGRDGAYAPSKPVDGTDGTVGSVEMYVKEDGQESGPFKTSYQLEIVDFDVVDDNEDGVLEFGENITLETIAVRNSGSLPLISLIQVTCHLQSH